MYFFFGLQEMILTWSNNGMDDTYSFFLLLFFYIPYRCASQEAHWRTDAAADC